MYNKSIKILEFHNLKNTRNYKICIHKEFVQENLGSAIKIIMYLT
jgi:hypothetical protein